MQDCVDDAGEAAGNRVGELMASALDGVWDMESTLRRLLFRRSHNALLALIAVILLLGGASR